ncbi:retrotransposon ORF1 [Tanacetum coccineum]
MAYSDKYKKILDGICLDKMKLDGMSKEEEEAIIKVKGEALIEKEDPGAFVIPIRLEGKINLNALADTGSDINVMPAGQRGSIKCKEGDHDVESLESRTYGASKRCSVLAKISLDTVESDSDDEEEYAIQRNKFGAPIYGPKPARLWEHTMMKPDHQDPNALDNTKLWRRMGCGEEINGMLRINLYEAGTNEEIFISVAWIRAFNINEPIYSELCHEFYSTYEFDEVCADDELKTKKIIKFRLGGRAHRGLRSDEHFNAQEYWLSISREENLSLSRSHASTIRILVLRVLHKMITYGLCQRTTGGKELVLRERERESLIYCGQFITKLARKVRVLSDEVLRSLSAPIYCRDLDTTMLRELIDSEGRLILRFHSRMYLGLLSRYLKEHRCRTCTRGWIHMVGVYNVPLRGAYNPPGYDQQQYDQYYQQYPPQQQQ